MPNRNTYRNGETLISVIIPVYNTAPFVRKCLDSVLENTYKNLQIICVNDGSIDESLDILLEYQKRDPRILVVDKPNGGVSSARNAGLAKAEGDHISFIDSDDVILNNYYEKLLRIMIQNEADIIDCEKAGSIHDSGNDDLSVFNNYGIVKNKAMRTYVAGKIYKKTIIRDCRFREGLSLYEDCIFNLDIVKKCISGNHELKGILVHEPMYCYIARSGSAMHQSSYEKAKPSITYLKEIANNDSNADVAAIYGIECIRKYLLSWYSLYLSEKTEECSFIRSEMKNIIRKIKQNNVYSGREKLPFILFANMPQLYRRYRILNDPTMKQYEKKIRNSR